ncbi:MAG: hypothetical protein ACREF1_07820, partial [Acetobacteraceae bacterium]
DHPSLADGWWAAEGNDHRRWRWTSGEACIPLPDGASTLEIRVVATMAYATQASHLNARTSGFVKEANRRAA